MDVLGCGVVVDCCFVLTTLRLCGCFEHASWNVRELENVIEKTYLSFKPRVQKTNIFLVKKNFRSMESDAGSKFKLGNI